MLPLIVLLAWSRLVTCGVPLLGAKVFAQIATHADVAEFVLSVLYPLERASNWRVQRNASAVAPVVVGWLDWAT